ncbi:FAD-dependent oxidoreductase [Thioalkalivibrio sulfidiphilus]|uniref:FAD dependent oxidoreductase n=1 Tax=Thioalkalivibrio sulfidiphilus (strain HL-EbGR7) TaxID=396588 RepID=B8GM91_THISH|nr:FAD-dependent oxidoreductase [Thioalkalivibrio sulfidiphilus]ACL73678.1 FAD dependent oxidoreductase [Thioalkalivibrio sulfidiphilus HL-EbGr7]
MAQVFDLLIVGGGVTGSALLYVASRYTDIKHIGMLEKYAAPARVNSLHSNNSQTLHCGDIETNYSLEKALKVQRAARMVENYAVAQPDIDHLIFRYPKMVLGVGERECQQLRKRFETLSPHYPKLRLLEAKDIARMEPAVAYSKGSPRADEIVALGSENEYTAVNFEALARSFVRQAQRVGDKQVSVEYNQRVLHIRRKGEVFVVETGDTSFQARSIVVCAGGHSLKLAHDLGYGHHFSVLPVAGSYYFTPQVLRGKVYTVQNDKLPFAAIHGDPDVMVPGKTRWGPTALVLPVLERYNWETVKDFMRVFNFDRKVWDVLYDLLKVPDIRNYMLKNFLFEVPVLRRDLFLRDVRKIVPDIKFRDLKFARHVGGIRPQLIDKENRRLMMGEAKIDTGLGAIFNMTPSPGATCCLENAEVDMRAVAQFLGAKVDEERFARDLLRGDSRHAASDLPTHLISGEDAS